MARDSSEADLMAPKNLHGPVKAAEDLFAIATSTRAIAMSESLPRPSGPAPRSGTFRKIDPKRPLCPNFNGRVCPPPEAFPPPSPATEEDHLPDLLKNTPRNTDGVHRTHLRHACYSTATT